MCPGLSYVITYLFLIGFARKPPKIRFAIKNPAHCSHNGSIQIDMTLHFTFHLRLPGKGIYEFEYNDNITAAGAVDREFACIKT